MRIKSRTMRSMSAHIPNGRRPTNVAVFHRIFPQIHAKRINGQPSQLFKFRI